MNKILAVFFFLKKSQDVRGHSFVEKLGEGVFSA